MKKILLFFLLLPIMAACSVDAGTDNGDGETVYLEIVPEIAGAVHAEIDTRAKVTSLQPKLQVGLCITGSSLHSMYSNFYAIYNGADWEYYLNNVFNGTLLSGFSSWGNIKLHGYYPYIANLDEVGDISAIPFRIATETTPGHAETIEETATVDYMVAGTKSKNMSVPGGGLVTLEFDHLMTAIDISMSRSYQGPTLTLSKVLFEIDGTRSFGIAGTYTAQDPDMSDLDSNLNITDQVQSLAISYSSTDKVWSGTGTKASSLVLMPQLAYDAGTPGLEEANVTLTFYFIDADGNPYLFDNHGNPQITFPLSTIDNGSGEPKGFLAGYNYVITASLGTYVKFEGGPKVVYEDMDENTNPEHIEI